MERSKEISGSKNILKRMLFISAFIHLFILIYIAGIYRSETMEFIELSLSTFGGKVERSIPRPRKRPSEKRVVKSERFKVAKSYLVKTDLASVRDDSFRDYENINIPDNAGLEGINPEDSGFAFEKQYNSAKDYFEMLKMKIENARKYPKSAIARRNEGQVSVRFVITREGNISSLQISKKTRFESLNRAALDAVYDAAPFPRPPPSLFRVPLKVEIKILFELT